MSKREIILLGSRALALLFAITALNELTYLPQGVFEIRHHMFSLSVVVPDNYWLDFYELSNAMLLVRIAINSAAAVILWKHGLKIAQLFLGEISKE